MQNGITPALGVWFAAQSFINIFVVLGVCALGFVATVYIFWRFCADYVFSWGRCLFQGGEKQEDACVRTWVGRVAS